MKLGNAGEEIEDMQKLVGVRLIRERHNTEATRPAIFRWERNIGNRNPLFLDEGYARKPSLGGLVAPPCWLYCIDNTFIALKLLRMLTIVKR